MCLQHLDLKEPTHIHGPHITPSDYHKINNNYCDSRMIQTPTTHSLTTCLSFSAWTHHTHLSLRSFCSGKLSMSISMHSTWMWQLQVCATSSSQTSTNLLCAITLSFMISYIVMLLWNSKPWQSATVNHGTQMVSNWWKEKGAKQKWNGERLYYKKTTKHTKMPGANVIISLMYVAKRK